MSDSEHMSTFILPQFCPFTLRIRKNTGAHKTLPVTWCIALLGKAWSYEVDWVKLIRAWVEDGSVPERVVLSKTENGKVVMSRPVYPYPWVSVYSGKGDANVEKNFKVRKAESRKGETESSSSHLARYIVVFTPYVIKWFSVCLQYQTNSGAGHAERIKKTKILNYGNHRKNSHHS